MHSPGLTEVALSIGPRVRVCADVLTLGYFRVVEGVLLVDADAFVLHPAHDRPFWDSLRIGCQFRQVEGQSNEGFVPELRQCPIRQQP